MILQTPRALFAAVADRRAVFRLLSSVFVTLLISLLDASTVEAESQDFVCYSFGSAASAVQQQTADSLVWSLGYITEPRAIVWDEERDDLILVGQRNPETPLMHLDDWVVALRTFVIKGGLEDPGVSIDPAGYQAGSEKMIVRFFGGVGNTRFGSVCFEADYLLKEMGLGLIPTGSPSVTSPWEMRLRSKPDLDPDDSRDSRRTRSFFWPKLVRVLKSKDAAVVEVCEVGVKAVSERASVSSWSFDTNAEDDDFEQQFADALTEHYDEVARSYPVLKKLRNLYGLYGLAKWVWRHEDRPDLGFWVDQYQVGRVVMPRVLEPVRQGVGGIGFGYQVSGEARLSTGAILLADGDPAGFSRAAVASRPEGAPLVWSFGFDDEDLSLDTRPSLAPAYEQLARAVYLTKIGKAQEALTCVDMAIDSGLTSPAAYAQRAQTKTALNDFRGALEDLDFAIARDSTAASLRYLKGRVFERLRDSDAAIEQMSQAIALSPMFEEARLGRAQLLADNGQRQAALAEYGAMLEKDPHSSAARLARAQLYQRMGEDAKAWSDLDLIVADGTDEAHQDSALTKLVSLRRKGRIGESPMSIEHFPSNAYKWARTMWEISIGARTSYDQDMGLGPTGGVAIATSNYRLSLPLSVGFVFRNRLRLSGALPFELVLQPNEIEGWYTTEYVILLAGGFGGASFGLDYQILDGLWYSPYLRANTRFYAPVLHKVFQATISTIEGVGDIPMSIGSRNWHWLLGLDGELPMGRTAKAIASASYLKPFGFEGRSYATPSLSMGAKLRLFTGEVSANVGFDIERSWGKGWAVSEDQEDPVLVSVKSTRYRFFIERFEYNSVWTLSAGVGQTSGPPGFRGNQYLYASVDAGRHIWIKRGWF